MSGGPLLPERDAPGGDLPVQDVLPRLVASLSDSGAAVLVAPPGSGKTTLVPLALADATPGRILVAEPRRVAARAAARRMATLAGGRVGDQVGYTVRGDRVVSPATRVEVLTTGVLVQRLQRDPELPGVAAVVIDECHERHLDTDLALALLVDVRANLRDDLMVLATSATAQADRIAAALGTETPVLTAGSRQYEVEVLWRPPTRPVTPPHGLRVDPALLDHVADTVRTAVAERPGDLLVFLPGAGEIRQVANRLGGLADIDVVTLQGSQSAGEQDAALAAGPRRRVVLATAVAESSLTVPGVRIVVDAGLSREPRTDHARGLDALVTVRVSRASAVQRAGRAGREAAGTVYRCWSADDQQHLLEHPRPEIATADLTGFVLELARWGDSDGAGLILLDPVPETAGAVARDTLMALGGLDADGRITGRGEAMARIGAHPRLARALLDGAGRVGARRAAEVVALLAADTSTSGDDLLQELRGVRAGRRRDSDTWRSEVKRLISSLLRAQRDAGATGLTDDLAAAQVVGLAYPERMGRLRARGSSSYLMTGGTAADLATGSRLTGIDWLAVAVADRQPGATSARIRLAAVADEDIARDVAGALERTDRQVGWIDGDVRARDVTRLGAIDLTARPAVRLTQDEVGAALLEGLRREGLSLLRFSDDAVRLRQRLAFCHHVLGDSWPGMDEAALVGAASVWLAPELGRARRRADLERTDVVSALRRLLDWQQAAKLDTVAPERITVPSGSQIRVDYADPEAPVLAVKVQECFGWRTTPTVGGGRVPVVLHLLSPAGRPAAVTADLESFWQNGYPQVRAELRGRYPKHPWPEDPLTAAPTRRTKPRR